MGTWDMQPKTKEAKKPRTEGAPLASQYGAIGPAAVAAALICSVKKQEPVKKHPAPQFEPTEA